MNYSIRNLVIAGGLAIVAIVAVLIYTSNVQNAAKEGQARVTVYVAKQDVPAGTPGKDVLSHGYLVQKEVVQDDQLPGVLTAATINGIGDKVLKQDLYTGQQVAAATFVAQTEAATTVAIQGTMRAVGVDVKPSNGLVGTLKDGDHVDIYARIGSADTRFVKKVLTNVLVLKAQIGQKDTTNVGDAHMLFALSDHDAQKLLWLADNGGDDFWLAQRPQEGALNSPPSVETLETLLGPNLPAAIQKLVKALTTTAGAAQ